MEQNNMTRQELIDYFRDVFELEKHLFTYAQIEPEYQKILAYIGLSPNFRLVRVEHFPWMGEPVLDPSKTYVTGCWASNYKIVNRYSNDVKLLVDAGISKRRRLV